MLFKNNLVRAGEATSFRDRVAGELETCIGIIGDKRHNNAHILACIFSAQVPTSLPPIVQSVARKVDYSYLKPSILCVDCSKKELNKFGDECSIWMEKSFKNADGDRRLIWVSFRSVLETDWVEILSRYPKISKKFIS